MRSPRAARRRRERHPAHNAGLDSVHVYGMSCPIEEIRKVDYQRMQADLRREAQNQGSPGSGASPQR